MADTIQGKIAELEAEMLRTRTSSRGNRMPWGVFIPFDVNTNRSVYHSLTLLFFVCIPSFLKNRDRKEQGYQLSRTYTYTICVIVFNVMHLRLYALNGRSFYI